MTNSKSAPRWGRWKTFPRQRPDWDARLCAYLERVERLPHTYGRHDCMLFAAGAIEAQTGRDFAEGHRGRYRSQAGAVRYLRGLGFNSFEAMLDAILPERPLGFVQRGDIVLAGGVPGVCAGAVALFVGEQDGAEGLVICPRPDWHKAWAV